ncbi:hypothetical protein H2203_008038 [Taxawa tesnikishii (nom. ined.)]|nr:hypothetical protein H2203_008038 [Dothideales sp. JES 119]
MSLAVYLLAACVAGSQFALAAPSTTPALRFGKDGTFQLSVFEDLHFGEAENLGWGPQQDFNSTRVMNSVLSTESQQLVVLNGDLITGENTYLANSSHYMDQIVAPLVQRNRPWASTLTQSLVSSPNAGVSNYYIPVYSSSSSRTPALLLWFFDSRGGNYFQQLGFNGLPVPQPNWVDQSVVAWFQKTNTALTRKHNNIIPSVAFVHIPVNAMLAFQIQGVDAHREPGINDDVPLVQQGYTQGQGEVSGTAFTYSGQDIPFMSALLETQELMAVFSGHDHGDDWCMKWEGKLPGMNLTGNGLDLCFGRHSGYGGYGSWMRGSRQVKIREGLGRWRRGLGLKMGV